MHVTVLLAVRNGEASVDAAIGSIVAQTYTDWDMILVDDASTDGSPAILDAWAARDPRMTVIHNPHNLGLAGSLNVAWPRARGELVARMDADDVSLPDRFEKQVEFLRAHPEVDMLGTGIHLFDYLGRPRGTVFMPERHEQLASAIWKGAPVFHSTVMMRRRLLEAMGGYDATLRRAEDHDLWLRAYRRFRFANLQVPLVNYRMFRRPTFRTMYYSTLVVTRAVARERRFLTHAWSPLRMLLMLVAAKLGIYSWRNT